MFYSQVVLAKKGPLAKVWMAAHWGDKKLSRPQIFTTDIDQSCIDIMNPTVPLALRLSGHLLLGVVRIYSRKVKYVLHDCNEAMIKLKTTFASGSGPGGTTGGGGTGANASNHNNELLMDRDAATHHLIANFGEYDQVHVVEGFCVPLPEENEWVLAEDDDDDGSEDGSQRDRRRFARHSQTDDDMLLAGLGNGAGPAGRSPAFASPEEETWAPFDPENEDDDDDEEDGFLPSRSRVSDIEIARAAGDDSMLSDAADKVSMISCLWIASYMSHKT
jgi:cohesin complex subunit SCC1